MLSLGIDYDATAWRAAAWDESRAVDLQTFTQVDELWEFVEDLTTRQPAMPIVLPSGLGIPVTRVGEILDQDIVEMTLQPRLPTANGLGKFLAEARRRSLRAFCIPAVKLLPTIPPHRKFNRLDLGTSDTLCAAAWAIHCLGILGRPQAACEFVLLHTRPSTRSLLVVQGGRIVDGTGTTADQTGPARGGLPPAFGSLPGGSPSARQTCEAGSATPGIQQAALRETVQKEALGLLGFHKLSELIPTGIRRGEFSQALATLVPLAQLPAPLNGYEAALGAAVIATGLTGGPTAPLVERLGLREARERVLDWIKV
jgi:predicted butyrate kinase (DUF1464 family)